MSARIVALDRFLLDRLVAGERDPLTAEMAEGDGFARRALSGPCNAMIDGGEVVVGGGLTVMWMGRAEAWLLVSRAARPRHLVMAARFCARVLEKRQRDPMYRRIEMFVRAGERWSESFAASLGFVREGRLRRWDAQGRDYLLFARVVED